MRGTTAAAWVALGAALLLLVAGCDKTLPDVPGVDLTVTPLAPDTNIATPIGTEAPGARTTPAAGGPAATPSLGPNQYVVQAGDTLSLIAARFHTTIEALRTLNNIKGDLINVGQALNIPTPQPATDTVATPSDTTAAAAAAPTATSKPAAKATSARVTYVVKRGDRLSVIAKRFGVSTSALARANGITNTDSIQPGQVLVIPGQ